MTKPVLEQARDIIFDGLMVRHMETLTDSLCRERANNIAMGLLELLCRDIPETQAPTDEDFKREDRIK